MPAANPDSVISVVLKSATTPRTAPTLAQFAMPSFAWRLSDEQVAGVATFARRNWGNDADKVDASAMSSLRPATHAKAFK